MLEAYFSRETRHEAVRVSRKMGNLSFIINTEVSNAATSLLISLDAGMISVLSLLNFS